jgi:hypothetical protein
MALSRGQGILGNALRQAAHFFNPTKLGFDGCCTSARTASSLV